MNNSHLGYRDERDKCYGITGMAITLVALDGEEYLAAVNLDADAAECVEMAPGFAFRGNPRMSAKIVWEQTLKDLRLTTSLALGNLACRRYVLDHDRISRIEAANLRDAMRGDAGEHCGLDSDEADRLFDSCLSYVDRIFSHSPVHTVAHSFAASLAERRSMTASEVVELLASLGLR